MRFSFPKIKRDKVFLVFVLVASITLASLINYAPEKEWAKELAVPAPMMSGVTMLHGRGEIPDLNTVMAHDHELADSVGNLSNIPVTDIFLNPRSIDKAVVDILLRWAGADQAIAQSFGPYIDARAVTFLQKAGVFPATETTGTEIPQEKAFALTQTWFDLYDHYKMVLLAQAVGKKIYQGGIIYDMGADKLTASGDLLPGFITQFDSVLKTSANSADAMRAFLDFINATKGFSALSDKDQDLIMSLDVRQEQKTVPSP